MRGGEDIQASGEAALSETFEMEREDGGQKQQEDKGVKRRAMIVERFEHDCN